MVNKEELRALLPHGSYKKIALKAGVSTSNVTSYFTGRIKSNEKIEKAALQVAIEYKKSVSGLVNELNSL